MNWCFVYKHYITGGLETFVLRMANYLVNNGHFVYLVCQSVSDEMKSQYTDSGAKIEYFDIWNRKKISQRMKGKVDIFISFGLSDYFLLGKYAKYAVSLMYCVHPLHATLDDRNKTFIEMLKCPMFYYIIKRGIENDTFLIMDENVRHAIYKKYKLSVKNSEILHLPYKSSEDVKKWDGIKKSPYSVLSICRADFPFKSYILGLIDAVSIINSNSIKMELTIVSYGKDIDVIKKKIIGKKYIRLIQETKYNELIHLYLNSDIYVGMGSTVVEASNYGLPIIIANANNENFVSCGYFYENPTQKGVYEQDGNPGMNYLKELLDCNYSQLEEMGRKNKTVFYEFYDIQTFIQSIMSLYCQKR